MIKIIQFILGLQFLFKKETLGASGFFPMPSWLRKILKRFHIQKQVAFYAQLVKGADMSMLAPDEYGCEESRTRLLRMVDSTLTPVFTYTKTGLNHMLNSRRFIEIPRHLANDGCIVMAATKTWPVGWESSVKNGHTGVLIGKRVYSNNSQSGEWDNAWRLDRFIEYYQKKGGMKVRFFAVI